MNPFMQDRVMERGIVMVQGRHRSRQEDPESPVAEALRKTIDRVVEIIRPCLTDDVQPNQLDIRIDALLSSDALFKSLTELSLGITVGVVAEVGSEGPDPLGVTEWLGSHCAEQVGFLLRENAKAIFAIAKRCRQPHPSHQRSERITPEILLLPSLYLGHRSVPTAVQRALLGRDIGQIALTGLVCAREWKLSHVRVAELYERFTQNQALWLEFLRALPGGEGVSERVMPESRTDFQAAFATLALKNRAVDRAAELLDKNQETAYVFSQLERDIGDVAAEEERADERGRRSHR